MKLPPYGDDGEPGRVYLVHFARPLNGPGRNGAGHYRGWARNVHRRMQEHRRGEGAKILAAANRAGIPYHVVAVEPGTRAHERRLEERGHARDGCPICNPTTEENMHRHEHKHTSAGNVGITSTRRFRVYCGGCGAVHESGGSVLADAAYYANRAGWRFGYRRDLAVRPDGSSVESTWRCPECIPAPRRTHTEGDIW